MKTLIISRNDYDKLLEHCPVFMQTTWQKLKKVWTVAGVIVTDCPDQKTRNLLLNHIQAAKNVH